MRFSEDRLIWCPTTFFTDPRELLIRTAKPIPDLLERRVMTPIKIVRDPDLTLLIILIS